MRIACHQPNFCPWFPFFYKMAMVDKFIILAHVKFDKENFHNRYNYKDKMITKPVQSRGSLIIEKKYVDGNSVLSTNMDWIEAIRKTLGIDCEILYDWNTEKKGTERILEVIKKYGGTKYITNSDAKNKYLDENLLIVNGIDIEYCFVPKHLKRSSFEVIEELGIEGAMKNLPRKTNEILSIR